MNTDKSDKGRYVVFSLAAVCLLLLMSQAARAQLPSPRLDRIIPLGGRAGTTVLVHITGKDLDDVKTLHFDHAGLKAEAADANKFKLTIAAATPSGTYEIRAIGKYGISGSRLFAVSHGLTEVPEVKPNNTVEKAQAIPMNAAVNGISEGNGGNFFRFPVKQGERFSIDCQAFRLDSLLRATVNLLTTDGKLLARSRPYFGRIDPFLDFTAAADGQYVVGIHDATYLGDLPFRLIVSNRPQIEQAFPPVVVPGESVELTLFGRNLPGARHAAGSTGAGVTLEEMRIPYTAPRDGIERHLFGFINHPPSPAYNTRGHEIWPPGIPAALNPVTLVHASAPVTREQEPNDTPEKAQALRLPTVVCGRFDKPDDVDWFSFSAKSGETIAIDLVCERMGRPGDPVVYVMDESGNEVARFDDHGQNVNALTQTNRDPLGTFTAGADGTYRLLVHERTRQGGPRYLYALRVGPPDPDFYPVVYHESANEPSCPTVRQGGAACYEFCLNRRDGYAGQVTVEAEGLPKGVSCPPIHLGPQTEIASVVFLAAADAPDWAGPVRLKAWGKVGDKRIEREIGGVQRRFSGDGNTNTASRVCREICLAVRSKAPYSLKTSDAKLTVAAGGTLETKVTVKRNWSDFKDKIQLTGLNLPPGFEFSSIDLPADQKEVPVKLTVAPEVPAGLYTVVLRGEAPVTFPPDPAAGDRTSLRIADPATPMTIEVTAPKK
jgi:hypothetical protein